MRINKFNKNLVFFFVVMGMVVLTSCGTTSLRVDSTPGFPLGYESSDSGAYLCYRPGGGCEEVRRIIANGNDEICISVAGQVAIAYFVLDGGQEKIQPSHRGLFRNVTVRNIDGRRTKMAFLTEFCLPLSDDCDHQVEIIKHPGGTVLGSFFIAYIRQYVPEK